MCAECGREYLVDRGIVHFVTSEQERLHNGKALALDYAASDPERLRVDYYRRQAAKKEEDYRGNPTIKEAVDLVVDRAGVVVDLATGHGGGYTAPIVKRLSGDAVLLATDACLPVIENWYECLRTEYSSRFAFLDIDLAGQLCFRDNSIDVFTGLAIANVHEVERLLREVHRCLKPDGWAVFQEMFFAPESETAALMTQQGSIYASEEAFADRMESVGLRMAKRVDVEKKKGKVDPRDGWPISDEDEWAEVLVHLQKQ